MSWRNLVYLGKSSLGVVSGDCIPGKDKLKGENKQIKQVKGQR